MCMCVHMCMYMVICMYVYIAGDAQWLNHDLACLPLHELQHARLLCPLAISQILLKFTSIELVMLRSHLIFCHPFSYCLQSFPVSGSFPMSWLFTLGGQSTGTSAAVLPIYIQDWFPLGLTGLISLQSKGLSRVFSSTTIWKNQFFGTQPFLWFNSHMHTWLLEKS